MIGYSFRVYDTVNKKYFDDKELGWFIRHQIGVDIISNSIDIYSTTKKRNEAYRYVIVPRRLDKVRDSDKRLKPLDIPPYR